MTRHAFTTAALLAASLPFASVSSTARAGMITSQATTSAVTTPVEQTTTMTASLPLTTTNFSTSNSKVAPLVFQQFDTQGGTRQLDSVDLTFAASIRNDFGITFTTPATITVSVATKNAAVPGPSITLYQPDGVHSLLTVSAPNDPSVLTRTLSSATAGTYGSDQPAGSKYYIAPAISQATNSLHLTAASDLALFTGSSKLSLPISASAFSTFSSNSGNGGGLVTTQGSASVTVNYLWHLKAPSPELVPEPASVILWGIGGLVMLAANRCRSRRKAL